MAFTQSEKNNFLARLTEIIEENLSDERFGVNELAREMGMSRSNLHRKLKAVKGVSISSYIRQVRLERAMVSLKQSSSTISEIAFEVGFHSVTYFTKSFHDYYGYAPGEVRKGQHMDAIEEELQPVPKRISFIGKQVSVAFLASIIAIFIAALILNIIFKPFDPSDQPLDKSIAVLPFFNDSPEETEMSFINGTMEAILDNLCKIEALRVVSRTSVEQYRNNPKPIREIGSEMNVSYVMEGSGLKQDDNIKLTIQLIDAVNDRHIWSSTYHRSVDKIFELQSEIAQKVADEIEVTITPREQELIENVPTTSQVAYDLYLHAWEGLGFYSSNETLRRAIDLFHHVIEYDPNFALAYARLGWIYNVFFSRNPVEYGHYKDSTLMYANKALSIDDRCEYAHELKGHYYTKDGKMHKAIECYDKALEISPNLSYAIEGKAWLYFRHNEFIQSIENFARARQLDRDNPLKYYYSLGQAYLQAGFPEKQMELIRERLALTQDSLDFFRNYAFAEGAAGNFHGALEAAHRGYQFSTTDWFTLQNLMRSHLQLGNDDKATEYCNILLGQMEAENNIWPYSMLEIIYLLRKSGRNDKADYYLDWLIDYQRINSSASPEGYLSTMAGISALQGDYANVYNYLTQLLQQEKFSVWVIHIRTNRIYKEISSEPEFIRIISEIEKKFEAQRERDRQLLEEKGLL
jgi:TolB-like protein/AraC-like DNA-binding protein/Tfp pilus assembly protein PilF